LKRDVTPNDCQAQIPNFIQSHQISTLSFLDRSAIIIDAEQARRVQ
jgi:hypothetical protein